MILLQSVFETGKFEPERCRQVFSVMANQTGALPGFGLLRGTGKSGRASIQLMGTSALWQMCGQPSAGNGAAMRVGAKVFRGVLAKLSVFPAPLACYLSQQPRTTFIHSIIQSSLLTHRDPRGISAAVAMAAAAAYLVDFSGKSQAEEEEFSARDFLVHVSQVCAEAEDILMNEYKQYILLPKDVVEVRCCFRSFNDLESNSRVIL